MTDFNQLSTPQLQQIKVDLFDRYKEIKSRDIALDITRGKPCPEQLDLSIEMLDIINSRNYLTADAVDCRNYGNLNIKKDRDKVRASIRS
jgi:hypothetical protein